jgi:CRP-like cAMP-binding protein
MNSSSVSAVLRDVLQNSRRRELSKGQIVQSTEGHTVNLLNEGYVKRYLISNDGALGTQIIYGPGNLFPITVLFKTLFNQDIYEGPEIFYYEAMSDIKLSTLDSRLFIEAAAKDSIIYRDLLSEAGSRLHATIHGLENLSLKSSYKRLAHQLVYFGRSFGKKDPSSSVMIKVPLTHQTLADMLSLTRETVSIGFVQLRKKKLIITGKNIVIPNIEKLEKEAYS